MSATTPIEWADKSWNPVRGCARVSEGCRHCYAERVAHRFSGPGKPYEGLTKLTKAGPQWTGKVVTVEDALLEPLSWRKPQRVFVNSMSDLFHEDVPDQFIVDVFGVMALAHWHTFQLLTKRPDRMRSFLQAGDHGIVRQFSQIQSVGGVGPRAMFRALGVKRRDGVGWQWPLPNVWLGTSVEDQPRADERIALLMKTPAAVRWVSAEPLLGPVDLSRWLGITWTYSAGRGDIPPRPGITGGWWSDIGVMPHDGPHLQWIVVGGESGPRARPCSLDWLRSIVEQCRATDGRTKAFVKQLGADPFEPYHDGSRLADVRLRSRKGGDMAEWAEDLRVREFPEARP